MSKVMKMLGRIVICLLGDKMIGKVTWYSIL